MTTLLFGRANWILAMILGQLTETPELQPSLSLREPNAERAPSEAITHYHEPLITISLLDAMRTAKGTSTTTLTHSQHH